MLGDIADCPYTERCSNNDKCYLCDDYRLLKLPKDSWGSKYRKRASREKPGWRGLEQQTADSLNALPTAREAHIKLRKRDVFGLKEVHKKLIETKVEWEPGPTETSGKKSTTVYEKDLRYFSAQAFKQGVPFLEAFRYKDDETVYILIDYEHIVDATTMLKFLLDENARFKAQLTDEEYQESIFPVLSETRRQLRSGGIWTMPGDVSDEILLVEAKQRSTTNSKGEPRFSIKKEVLEKIEKEAGSNRIPLLVFRMQDDGRPYAVIKYDYLMDLIYMLEMAVEENKLLQKKVMS